MRLGDAPPPLQGDDLTGKSATFPAVGSSKTTLVMPGFAYASRATVEAWGEWFRDTMDVHR